MKTITSMAGLTAAAGAAVMSVVWGEDVLILREEEVLAVLA